MEASLQRPASTRFSKTSVFKQHIRPSEATPSDQQSLYKYRARSAYAS